MLLAAYAEALSTTVEVVRDWLRTYPESPRDTIGRLPGLRDAMAERGYAAEDLARASGVSTARAEEWVRGRRSLPGSVVPVVSDLLGTDVMKARSSLVRSDRPTSGLASLRAARGLTQAELGQTMGVSASTVGMWEIGRARPNALRLRMLSASLRVDIAVVAATLHVTPPRASRKEELLGLPLGPRLKALRRETGFDCEQVARIIGVRGSTIRRWESGATEPGERLRRRLAVALSCDESILTSGSSRDATTATTSLRGTG
jgi:transcriptional regulator with XRE-family HTH domain